MLTLALYYRTNELQDSLERAQDALRKIESDIEESQGERAEKLKGLLTQEQARKGLIDFYFPDYLLNQ